MKTSLDVLSKHFVGIELDWRLTLGFVTLVWVKSARVTAVSTSDSDEIATFDEIVYMTKNILNNCYTLHYQGNF